jgi:DNA polymerase III sliding clamp (beta) subunit (PCNA family)
MILVKSRKERLSNILSVLDLVNTVSLEFDQNSIKISGLSGDGTIFVEEDMTDKYFDEYTFDEKKPMKIQLHNCERLSKALELCKKEILITILDTQNEKINIIIESEQMKKTIVADIQETCKVINASADCWIDVDKKVFLKTLKVFNTVKGTDRLKILLDKDMMSLNMETETEGCSCKYVIAKGTGKLLKSDFNINILIRGIKNMNSDEIKLGFAEKSPLLINGKADNLETKLIVAHLSDV